MINAKDTALKFVKPKKGTYRIVSIPDGAESKLEVIPADGSVRLSKPPRSGLKHKLVWEYLFGDKNACRLKYEGSETYSFRFWDDESFTIDTDYGPIFLEKI